MTNETTTFATVRFELVGFHRWEMPTPLREYLKLEHRHKFHVELSIEVFHADREVEFHDLAAESERWVSEMGKPREGGGLSFGTMSCEIIAARLVGHAIARYGADRAMRCKVFEDAEHGAEVHVKAKG